MKCPVCNIDLLMSEKQGIEIDYCPQCRGIWLDRGELEKIIERTNSNENPTVQHLRDREEEWNLQNERDHGSHDSHNYNKYGRKKSFFSELFD
jgi:Zn-finger nucleic acid-binding protein